MLGLTRLLDARVYVALGRGLWDFTAKDVYDYVESLQEDRLNKVCLSIAAAGAPHVKCPGMVNLRSGRLHRSLWSLLQCLGSAMRACRSPLGYQAWSDTHAKRSIAYHFACILIATGSAVHAIDLLLRSFCRGKGTTVCLQVGSLASSVTPEWHAGCMEGAPECCSGAGCGGQFLLGAAELNSAARHPRQGLGPAPAL